MRKPKLTGRKEGVMCFEERLFRSWAAKQVQKRERNITANTEARSVKPAVRPEMPHEPSHRKEPERAPAQREVEVV